MSLYANGTNVPYPPDCADCPQPAECKAKNDCAVMRQIRHGHEKAADLIWTGEQIALAGFDTKEHRFIKVD